MVTFEHEGVVLLREGRMVEAFEAHRRSIAAEPDEPGHRMNLAWSLLRAGLGRAARAEAQRAAEAAPDEAHIFHQLAWIRLHDLVGRGPPAVGDRDGALRAFERAVALDPDFEEGWLGLGAMRLLGADGRPLGPSADPAGAVAAFRTPPARGVPESRGPLLVSLFAAGRPEEVVKEARSGPVSSEVRPVVVAAVARTEGAEAARREAARLVGPVDADALLDRALQLLIERRHYEAARRLAGVMDRRVLRARRRALIGRLRRLDALLRERTDRPEAVALRFLAALYAGGEAESVWRALLAPSGRAAASTFRWWSEAIEFEGAELSSIEVVLAGSETDVETAGRTATVRYSLLPRDHSVHLVRTKRGWRVEAAGHLPPTMATAALWWAERGRLEHAAALVEAAVEYEEPVTGRAPPKVTSWARAAWPGREGATLADVRRAAAGLLMAYGSKRAEEALRLLRAAGPPEPPADAHPHAVLELWALRRLRRDEEILNKVRRLREARPRSEVLLEFESSSLSRLGRADELEALARSAPAVPSAVRARLLREAAYAREQAGDLAASLALVGQAAEVEPDEAINHYRLVWIRLCAGDSGPATERAASRAVEVSDRKDANALFALAALRVEQGRLSEARELLLDVVALDGELGPDDGYVTGRMLEQLGFPDHAAAEYRTVIEAGPKPPPHCSMAEMAERRLAHLEAAAER